MQVILFVQDSLALTEWNRQFECGNTELDSATQLKNSANHQQSPMFVKSQLNSEANDIIRYANNFISQISVYSSRDHVSLEKR